MKRAANGYCFGIDRDFKGMDLSGIGKVFAGETIRERCAGERRITEENT